MTTQRAIGWLFGFAVMVCHAHAGDNPKQSTTLDGVWEITTLIENGQIVAPAEVQSTLMQDGQLVIQGPLIKFVNPINKEKRTVAFVTGKQGTLQTLDLAGAKTTAGKGIYQVSGDVLYVCLNGPDQKARPTVFTSTAGSQSIFMILKKKVVAARPAPPPLNPAPVVPKKIVVNRDAQFHKMLLGTWGSQTSERVDYITFNSDGTVTVSRSWKGTFRKMFHKNVRSSGTWNVKNGVILMRITASTDSKMRNQVFSFRINSITDHQLIGTTQDGQVGTQWRVKR
ncbi:MAG: hypothetical protein ACFCD0_11060 [Gemmataceae bacterium]